MGGGGGGPGSVTYVTSIRPDLGVWGARGNIDGLVTCGRWVTGSVATINGPLVVMVNACIYDGNISGSYRIEPVFSNLLVFPPVSYFKTGWTGWYDWSGGLEKNAGIQEYRIHCRISFRRTVPLPSGTPVLLLVQPAGAIAATNWPIGVGKEGDWGMPRNDEQVQLSADLPAWPLDQIPGRSARATRSTRFQQVCYELHAPLDAQSPAGKELESMTLSPGMLKGRVEPIPDIGL